MRSDTKAVYWALAAVIVLGAAVRLYHLDHQSLWHDEAISVTVSRAPLDRIPNYFKAAEGRLPIEYNPPVYALLLHGWFKVIGAGGFEARLFSAVAGILALPLIFALGRRLYDAGTGLCAALLLALSQLGVMFSQEARNYEVFLLLVLATSYFYWIAWSRRRLAAWCACTVAAVLMVLTQYYGVFVIVALAIYTALYWRSIPLSWVAGAAAVGAAAMLPWLGFALAGQVQAASDRVQPAYFAVGLSSLAGTINRFNNGALKGLLGSAPAWTFAAGAVLFGGPILLLLARARRRQVAGDEAAAERRSTVFALLLWAVPLLSVLALGLLLNVQYNVRYVAFCIGPYYLLVAAGLMCLPPAIRWLTVATLIAYSGYALSANYGIPYKENYRDAIRFVASEAQPDDCYAFVPFGGPPLQWTIYAAPPPTRRLMIDRELPAGGECRRIWVVTYLRVVLDAHERWRTWLATVTAGYAKSADRRFFWITVERYDRPAPR